MSDDQLQWLKEHADHLYQTENAAANLVLLAVKEIERLRAEIDRLTRLIRG